MRVLFFGTPAFAVPTFEALLASTHAVVGAVTQPDRPRGRGRHLAEPPVKVVAKRAGVPVWQPERLKEASWLETVRALAPDVAVVAAYGRILPQVLLDIPPHGFLNVHASLLPKYRGASPIQRAVMNGDTETGVTIIRLVLALDAGPMLASRRRAIGPDETSEQVERDLASMGAALLVETLDLVESGRAAETPQDERAATFAPRLTKDEGAIDWNRPARDLHNLVRGLQPWPHAFSLFEGTRLAVLEARPDAATPPSTAPPGTVLEAKGDRLVVAAGEGTALRLLRVQPEGRRVMTAREFLAGHPARPGSRFETS